MFLVENKETINYVIELGHVGCQIGSQLCADSLTEMQGLQDLATMELSKVYEKIGFQQFCNWMILKREFTDKTLWCITKPTAQDILAMNTPMCSLARPS